MEGNGANCTRGSDGALFGTRVCNGYYPEQPWFELNVVYRGRAITSNVAALPSVEKCYGDFDSVRLFSFLSHSKFKGV